MSDDTTTDTQAGSPADDPTSTATDHPKERALTQDDLNRILAAEKRKWQAQAKREADEAAAAAQGEFKTLAEQRAQRIAELEQQTTTAAEVVERYQAEMQKHIAARLKALPAEIKAMQPDGDPLVVYAWLEKAEAAASKLTTAAASRTPPPGPAGGGAGPLIQGTTNDAIERKRASGIY